MVCSVGIKFQARLCRRFLDSRGVDGGNIRERNLSVSDAHGRFPSRDAAGFLLCQKARVPFLQPGFQCTASFFLFPLLAGWLSRFVRVVGCAVIEGQRRGRGRRMTTLPPPFVSRVSVPQSGTLPSLPKRPPSFSLPPHLDPAELCVRGMGERERRRMTPSGRAGSLCSPSLRRVQTALLRAGEGVKVTFRE